MKSSGAVFTRQNPFPPEPLLARTHYSPTRPKKISKQQKKLALSPVRFGQRGSSPESPPQTSPPSPEDQLFLEGSHRVVLCPPPSVKEHQSYSESWPSTDLETFRVDLQTSDQDTVTRGTQEPSVLAKYIERFRYGRPQSREERQRLAAVRADEQHFSWTSTSPPPPSSSTPTQTSKERFRGLFDCRNDGRGITESQPNTSLSPTKGLLDLSVLALSDSSHAEPGEPEILQLQERASRLLQKSENSLSSGSGGLPISSEGLGCSDFSSPVSYDEPVRRPLVSSLMDSTNLLTTPGLSGEGPGPALSALGTKSHIRPEDDILFQWRLRRKMEQARQWSHTSSHSSSFPQPALARLSQQPSPVLAFQGTSLSFTPASVEQTGPINLPVSRQTLQPALPVSIVPEPSIQDESDSLSWGHLVSQPVRERATLDPQKPCTLPQPQRRIQKSSSDTSLMPCNKHQPPSSPSPQTSDSTEGEWSTYQHRDDVQTKSRAVVKGVEKKTVTSTCKTKSKRHAEGGAGVKKSHHVEKASVKHGRVQERISCKSKESRPEKRWHSGGQRSSGDRALPSSPLYNTLGLVVSEVLFPGSDSPTQSRTPCSSDSPRCTPPPPPPPPQTAPQPAELIGQLMQEAQDSDGLEFEDDPLLLVLRQQRKWVNEQLCEIDKMLEDLHED